MIPTSSFPRQKRQTGGHWKHVKTTYEYDEDGNLISESSGKKDTKTYEYTGENHLKSVTTSNEVLMAALYDGDGNRLFTLDYVEDGKDSQKGQVLIPESAKTESGDSPQNSSQIWSRRRIRKSINSITQYVNDINRENTEVLMELRQMEQRMQRILMDIAGTAGIHLMERHIICMMVVEVYLA